MVDCTSPDGLVLAGRAQGNGSPADWANAWEVSLPCWVGQGGLLRFHFNGPEQTSDSMPAGPAGAGTSAFSLENGGFSC